MLRPYIIVIIRHKAETHSVKTLDLNTQLMYNEFVHTNNVVRAWGAGCAVFTAVVFDGDTGPMSRFPNLLAYFTWSLSYSLVPVVATADGCALGMPFKPARRRRRWSFCWRVGPLLSAAWFLLSDSDSAIQCVRSSLEMIITRTPACPTLQMNRGALVSDFALGR